MDKEAQSLHDFLNKLADDGTFTLDRPSRRPVQPPVFLDNPNNSLHTPITFGTIYTLLPLPPDPSAQAPYPNTQHQGNILPPSDSQRFMHNEIIQPSLDDPFSYTPIAPHPSDFDHINNETQPISRLEKDVLLFRLVNGPITESEATIFARANIFEKPSPANIATLFPIFDQTTILRDYASMEQRTINDPNFLSLVQKSYETAFEKERWQRARNDGWTVNEVEHLKLLADQGRYIKSIAASFPHKSIKNVRKRMKDLGLAPVSEYNVWTPEEDTLLLKLFKEHNGCINNIAIPNRTNSAIKCRLSLLRSKGVF